MTLTVKEKEHWKERIAQKIERRIESLVESTQRDYLNQIGQRARQLWIEQLDLTDNVRRQTEIESTIDQLNNELLQLQKVHAAASTGMPVQEIESKTDWAIRNLLVEEQAKATKRLERTIMAEDELGREILKLREEQEELLDTVWLATSTKQIRDLWQSVAELLNEKPTTLQTAAINTDVVDNS